MDYVEQMLISFASSVEALKERFECALEKQEKQNPWTYIQMDFNKSELKCILEALKATKP